MRIHRYEMIMHTKRVTKVISPSVLITISSTDVEKQDSFSRGLISQRKWWMLLEPQKRRQLIRRTSKREWR